MGAVVEVRGLTKRFPGRWALRGVDLALDPGQVLGILGPNGSGKSTLLKVLAGVLRPTAGTVLVLGRRPGRETKGRVAHLPDVDHLYQGMTGRQALSRGLRARFKLALALARRAGLLLLDEPLAGIDVVSRGRILNAILAEYRLGEQAILLATHEIAEAEALFDRVAFLREGLVVLEGAAEELRARRGKSVEDIYREEFA